MKFPKVAKFLKKLGQQPRSGSFALYSLRSEIIYILALKFVLKYTTFQLLANNNIETEMVLLSLLDVVIFNVAWIGCSHI